MKKYKYLPIDLPTKQALQQALSSQRLQVYKLAAENDEDVALALHAWNAHLGAALFLPLQMVEVSLRNAIDVQLSAVFGHDWLVQESTAENLLDAYDKSKVEKAKRSLRRRNCDVNQSNLMAELSFGFWVALLGRGDGYHDRLWIPHLHKVFSQGLSREEVYRTLKHLQALRNRIAHHEPIFHRHLEADYATILRVCAWMHKDVAAWVDGFDDFALVLAQRPSAQAKKTWLQRVIPWL